VDGISILFCLNPIFNTFPVPVVKVVPVYKFPDIRGLCSRFSVRVLGKAENRLSGNAAKCGGLHEASGINTDCQGCSSFSPNTFSASWDTLRYLWIYRVPRRKTSVSTYQNSRHLRTYLLRFKMLRITINANTKVYTIF
jgi:hypothetical protein